jgi:spore maturation protein CgeB
LLAERTHRHLQYYREGAEAEFFDASNADELASKVHKLLADSDFRESLRANGMLALKRQQHTYTDRLSRLVQVFHSTRKITRYA